MNDKKLIQKQLIELVQQDVMDIVREYLKTKILNLELVCRLVQDINLFSSYNVSYMHNIKLDEVIGLMRRELKDFSVARVIALLTCFDYLQNSNQDFKKLMYVNLSLKVNSEIFLESFSFFDRLVSSIKELFNDFISYIFNNRFLTLDENIQIEIIYKIWNTSQQLFHDNEASIFAYENLKLLFEKALIYEKAEVAFWLYYTPLHFFNSGTGSDIDKLNEKFKIEIEKPLEKYILEKLIPKYQIKLNKKEINKNKKIKVAFVIQRIIQHSTIKVFYSLVNSLMKNKNEKYEFIIYDLFFAESGGSDIDFVNEFKALGIKYINVHVEIFGNINPNYSLVKKCIGIRERLIKDSIDIMIGLHTRVEYIFLYTTRAAPKQIYWYHSSNAQYDISGIDFRIKHGDFLVNEAFHDKFKFLQFGDILERKYLNPEIDSELIKLEKIKYPKNVIILGTIGRLSKVDNIGYIGIIDEILKKNINTIYIAAGTGDISSIKTKITRETLPQWFFPGHVEPHLYGQIIDIWPNTFPNPQGLSTLEFMAKGKPVLTMKNNFHDFEVQNNYNKIRTDKFKDYKMNVENIEEYKRSLNLLINNMEARELIGKLNLKYIEENYYNTTKSLNSFYKILEEVIS